MLVFSVNSIVEMLLLFQLHSVQSIWGFSLFCLCDLVKLVWQGSCKTCVGLGNLSSRMGHLVVLAACVYFESRGKDPAFVSPVVLICKKHQGFFWW